MAHAGAVWRGRMDESVQRPAASRRPWMRPLTGCCALGRSATISPGGVGARFARRLQSTHRRGGAIPSVRRLAMTTFATNATPTPVVEPETENVTKTIPPYHVILENDDHHTMDFVVDVLRKVFGYELPRAFQLMMHAHEKGESIVWTGPKEVAELKVEQMCTFHQTHPVSGKQLGPLGCRIEPAA